LLLKGHDEAKGATGKDLAIYGQENDLATWALAKMNMFLHDCPSAEIWKGNTLSNPHFTEKGSLKTFDFAVANPPSSSKALSYAVNTVHELYDRFAFGVPPPKKRGERSRVLRDWVADFSEDWVADIAWWCGQKARCDWAF
jgi:type I restriction enzyme M protein